MGRADAVQLVLDVAAGDLGVEVIAARLRITATGATTSGNS